MKTKLKQIVFTPIFQSAMVGILVTLLVIFIWDAPIKRYNIELEPFGHKSQTALVHWFAGDFNNDGNSERIRCFNGAESRSMDLVHYDKDGNLSEHYHFNQSDWSYNFTPGIFDIDKDEVQELLFFSHRNDSIFLNALNLSNFELIIDHLYFNQFEKIHKNYAYRSEFLCFGDLNKNGSNELFFLFDAGFGLYPRGIFKLNFPSLEFISSPTEYMGISRALFKDFNNDERPKIITSSYAPCNVTSYNKYTDTISYTAVLDYQLNPIFTPIPFPYPYSSSHAIPSLQTNNKIFYRLLYGRANSHIPIKIQTLDYEGNILVEKSWENIKNPENRYMFITNINRKPYLFIRGIGHFQLTSSLKLLPDKLKPNTNSPSTFHKSFDLNEDGFDEWINVNSKNEFSIYNEISNEQLRFDSPIRITNEFKIFRFVENHITVKYMVDTGTGFFFFNYQKNTFHFILYLIYILVFSVTTSLIFTILSIQKRIIDKKWNTEKQLSELQFNVVKNQLNPHFLFNALNSVAYMINAGKKDEAYNFLAINSRMIQRVMNDAKEVKRPLKDELQFTKDYLGIQKHRFKERFKVEINIAPKLNQNVKVPKMCVHTYVENAIKHGFRNTKEGGLLVIEVKPFANGVSIIISDNGMGRLAALEYKDSSGNGIKIMNEFYQLFEKYHGYKINFSIADNTPIGTVVNLKIRQPTSN